MHASVPTASSIWNAFQSSHKKHLLITGSRGSGKTTLLSTLFEKTLPGITTFAIPKKSVFLKDNSTSKTEKIALFDDTIAGKENKMSLCSDSFRTFGVSILQKSLASDEPWISIDEIGYLECSCSEYLDAIRRIMNQKHLVAVIRKQELPFLQELISRNDVFLIDLDQPYGNPGCVIMASGLGKRFGQNKLMADFHGMPIIDSILSVTEPFFSKRIIVTRHDDVAEYCKNKPIDVLLHDQPFRSDTVRLGLQALGSGIEYCAFFQGDQPLVRPETVASLLLAAANVPDFIWRTAWKEHSGSPVLFPKWTFPELLDLPQGKGGNYLTKKYPEQVHTVQVRDANELRDIDTPKDLSELLNA